MTSMILTGRTCCLKRKLVKTENPVPVQDFQFQNPVPHLCKSSSSSSFSSSHRYHFRNKNAFALLYFILN